jgi:hypothetical protein
MKHANLVRSKIKYDQNAWIMAASNYNTTDRPLASENGAAGTTTLSRPASERNSCGRSIAV